MKRNIFETIKKIGLIIIETLVIVLICNFIPYFDNVSYVNWIINAIITGTIAIIIVFTINILVYKQDMKLFVEIFKKLIQRTKTAN